MLTVLTQIFLLVLFLNRSEARSLPYPMAFHRDDFQLPGGIVTTSSPTLADLDGDEVPEVLVGTTACRGNMQGTCTYDQATVLVIMKGDGNIWWSRDVGAPIGTAPAVGDINNDGHPEVVVSFKGDTGDPNPYHGGLVAYTYDGSTELWRFYTQDQHPKDGYGDFVVSSPTLCDVDDDGDMEIAFGGGDQRIYLLDHNGNSLWNDLPHDFPGPGYMNADSIWSTAACADLNQDGQQEIIIGADITGGGVLPDGTVTQDGGFLYVFDIHGNVLVRRHLPETLYAAPAIGDLEGDGDLEIVSGTGWYWWHAHGRTEQPYVYVFDTSQVFSTLPYTNPNKLPYLPGWPQPTAYPGFSSPALADLDGDENGDLEIVIGAGHPDSSAGDGFPGAGLVYAWHHDATPVDGWPVAPENAQGKDGWLSSSPTVADVDADGGLEVLFSLLWDVQVYNADGSFQERLETNWTVWGSPAVGDADGDGYLEVWIGSSNVWEDPAYGYLWRFESNTPGIGELPWPMFHRDAQNAGAFIEGDPDLQVAPTDIALPFVKGQSPADQQFTVTNNGGVGSTLDWHATIDWTGSAATEWFSLSTTSGSLAASASETVDVSVEATKVQSPGTYRGTINVSGAEQSATVVVEYVVPPPALQLGAKDVAFLMEPTDDDEKRLQVTLRNAGGGAIQWSVPADYPSWLQVDPQSGMLESTSVLTLTVDKAGLSEGTRTASVRVEPVDLDPQTIGVKLYIGPVQKIFLPLALRH